VTTPALYRASTLLAEMLGQRISASMAASACATWSPKTKKIRPPRRTHVTPRSQECGNPRHCPTCFRLAFPGETFPSTRPQRFCRHHRVVTMARATLRMQIRQEVARVALAS
jgi:hypothetical protein